MTQVAGGVCFVGVWAGDSIMVKCMRECKYRSKSLRL